jgi:hypothetical protein
MDRLAGISSLLRNTRAELKHAFDQVPSERWRTPPAADGWSAAHVAAHLEMVEAAIQRGAEKLLARPPVPTPLLKRLHFPVEMVQWRWPRARTPIPLDEALLADRETMVARLSAVRQKTYQLLDGLAGRDLRPFRWQHPFLGNFNFYDWFKLIGLHERRHTKQIREIVRFFQS